MTGGRGMARQAAPDARGPAPAAPQLARTAPPPAVLYADSREDHEGFDPDRYVPTSREASARWRAAIAR